jgi:hypothetical protein
MTNNETTDLLADLKNEQKQTKTILRALANLPVESRPRVLAYVEGKLPAIPAPKEYGIGNAPTPIDPALDPRAE